MNVKRYAIVRNARTEREVRAYLPDNYEVIYEEPASGPRASGGSRLTVVIAGRDVAGWTLDHYVLPRLASGLLIGEEIDLSHEVMKRVPA